MNDERQYGAVAGLKLYTQQQTSHDALYNDAYVMALA